MNLIESLLTKFELKKFKKECNFFDCENIPHYKIIVQETNLKNAKNRILINLYFCGEHIKNANEILKNLINNSEPKTWIKINVKNTFTNQ